MSLTRLAVRNPIGVLMVCLAILVLATISASRIPIDMFPSLNVPALRIDTKYPGASPEEIERTITYPLEQAIARVGGVVRVESDSEAGASRITLWFDWGSNLDTALVQVISNVQRAMNSLPEGLEPPAVSQFDVADFPVLQLAMHSPGLTPEQAYELGEYVIGPQLSRIKGVSEVRVRGGLLRQINIDCDPALLQARGVSLLEVRTALQNNNQLIPSGLFQNPDLEYQLEVETMLSNVEQVREVPVATRNNVVIKVRDVATVEDGTAIPTQIFRVDSQQRVGIWIMMQPRTNVVELSNAVREALKNLSGLPEGVRLDLIFDQSNYVRTSINGLVHEGVWGAILVSFVVLIFLRNWPSVLLICTGIPLSLATAVMLLYFGDQSLNIFTLGGLTLALGRVVDDAIVVRENITRHLEEATESDGPVDVEKAVLEATGEVGMPVLASTLTTIAVFFPVVFLEGVSAKLFVPLALTISFAMIASYFVSLTVDPVLSITWKAAQRTVPEHEMTGINRLLGKMYDRMESIYERLLAWVARRSWLIFLGVLGAAVGSYLAARTVATEFFPKSDESVISMRVESQMGTGAIAMGEICAQLEEWIREVVKEGEVLAVITSAGTPSNSARMFVRLSLPTQRTRSAEEISAAIRKNVSGRLPGVRAVVTPGGLSQRVLNFGAGSPVEIQLLGHDQEAGGQFADALSRKVAEVPGVVDVRVDPQGRAPSLKIELDRQRIALMGLTPGTVATTINTAMTGGSQGGNRFLDPVTGNEFNMATRLSEAYRDQPEDLEAVPVSVLFPTSNATVVGNASVRRTARVANNNSGREYTEAGKPLLVRDLARIELEAAPLMIRRTNQTRVIRVTGNNTEPIGAITTKLRQLLDQEQLPPGFTYYIGGQAEQQERTFQSMMLAAALALMLVYMIMASQFGSLWEPLVIMVTVPLGLIGVVIIQLATGTPFSVMSFMGVIMMTGIVVSNGILLVEFSKTLRERGLPLWEAVMTAARLRLRPIIMTALCTIVGMIPMAAGMGGSETNEPLAQAVIGGLTVSTLLTLFVVPLVYRTAAELVDRRAAAQNGANAPAESSPDAAVRKS
jgi:CzcA family heavy metal efflux pump